MELRKIPFACQKEIRVPYKGVKIEGQRLDLVVNDVIVVELKAVETLLPIHEAQLLSYLKTTTIRVGLLMNFNVKLLKDGMRRIVL